jgi:hypothetical protein
MSGASRVTHVDEVGSAAEAAGGEAVASPPARGAVGRGAAVKGAVGRVVVPREVEEAARVAAGQFVLSPVRRSLPLVDRSRSRE